MAIHEQIVDYDDGDITCKENSVLIQPFMADRALLARRINAVVQPVAKRRASVASLNFFEEVLH